MTQIDQNAKILLAEDDNDTVVKETRRLKKAVEDVAGPIDGL